MPRHIFTREECSKAGKSGSKENKSKAGRKGFWATMEKHPYMYNRLRHAPGMKEADRERFNPK